MSRWSGRGKPPPDCSLGLLSPFQAKSSITPSPKGLRPLKTPQPFSSSSRPVVSEVESRRGSAIILSGTLFPKFYNGGGMDFGRGITYI